MYRENLVDAQKNLAKCQADLILAQSHEDTEQRLARLLTAMASMYRAVAALSLIIRELAEEAERQRNSNGNGKHHPVAT